MNHKLKPLIGFIALIIVVQTIGSFATFSSVQSWYPTLNKVAWNPPAWVFGPVWTALYIMIAVSGWRVWVVLGPRPYHHWAMHWYFFQLVINLMWSVLFFGLRNPLAGLLDIVVLLGAIMMTIISFWRLDKQAGLLLIPYVLWVLYASTLNAGIVYLN
ncbi:MAG: tryptophan-rich sensory protein [Alphaproteobacteria bacterium]|nr:tryptophan-rich sensory protein [Alphaproteobacteria bacterium]